MPARVETVALLSQNCGVEISKNTPVWREGQFSAFAKTSRRTNHHRLSLCRTCGIVLALFIAFGGTYFASGGKELRFSQNSLSKRLTLAWGLCTLC